ncbi:MAG: hypothetical protein AAGG01_06855 [Planctomycetota bacterium]
MELLINLISGAVGGNLLGALTKGSGLIRTILGLVGGGLGNFVGPDLLSKIGALAESGQAGQAGMSAGLGGILAMVGGLLGKKKEA